MQCPRRPPRSCCSVLRSSCSPSLLTCRAEVGYVRVSAIRNVFCGDGLNRIEARLVRLTDQRAGHFKLLQLLDVAFARRGRRVVRGRRCSRARCRRRSSRCGFRRRRTRRRSGCGRLALCKCRNGNCGRQRQFSPDYSFDGQRQCPLFHFSPSRSSVRPQLYVMRDLMNLSTRYTAILRRVPFKAAPPRQTESFKSFKLGLLISYKRNAQRFISVSLSISIGVALTPFAPLLSNVIHPSVMLTNVD